jgi:hypothetical protein
MAIVIPSPIKPNAKKSQPQCLFSMPRLFLNSADTNPNPDRIGCSYRGTFLCHLPLSRMTIQQDPYEPDRWWFAPLLYAGAAVVIAVFVLA